MKLLNKSLLWLSVSLFFIISLWSLILYFNMLTQIKKSVDEGLDNYKRQIVRSAQKNHTIEAKNNFEEGFFTIHEITQLQALAFKDRYIDTLLYMQDADDVAPELEPVRLLTTAFENNEHYYKLRIINPMVEEDDLIKELFFDAVWLYLLMLISLIAINNFVLQRVWNPFYTFLHQLKIYRIGNNEPQPNAKSNIKEFTDLQHAVSILLQQNTETFEQQKQFIGNASHELQTPLAVSLNKLELLIEKGNLNNEQAESIAEIITIIERLARLNKSLLLLTKIENKQFLGNQVVSLNEVIQQSIKQLEEFAAYKNLKISTTENANLTAAMDLSLANIIVSNLLRNAIFHNTTNGIVNIFITDVAIKICNTGTENPLNAEKIFSRFYKSENEQNNTGLGLAIVKAICDLYGFSISYSYANALHCFEVRMK